MWKLSWVSLVCAVAFAVAANAQGTNPCAVPSAFPHSDVGIGANKVACTLPQLYGRQGLVFPPNGDLGPIDQHPNIGTDFSTATKQQELVNASINSNVAGQIALLPFVAPASGITFTFDKSLFIYTESPDSFGPIFSERASTIGRHRLSVGVAYQYLDFDSLGGINLHSFPTTFLQAPTSEPNCPASDVFSFRCLQTHDYVTATNRIDLTIHQITSFVTFGLTRNIDISVAVPYVRVQMSAIADARIAENGGGTEFAGCNGVLGDCGLQNTFSNARHAAGIGDVTLRAKGTIRRWERASLAAGIDVRIPTGSAINLLGAGAVGIKPFGVWSYGGRISPHVNLAYQWNGKSILGADVTTGGKGSLPSQFLYSVGLEAAIKKRLTATLDLIGQRIFNAPVDTLVPITVPSVCNPSITVGNKCLDVGAQSTTIGVSTGDYWIHNGNIGLRLRPFGKLLITGSVLLKLDNGGLRSKAIPLASATYTFN